MKLEIFILNLVVIQLLVDAYTIYDIKKGVSAFSTEYEDDGWVIKNFTACLVFGFVYTLIVMCAWPMLDSVSGKDTTFIAFLLFGAMVWIVNIIILSIVCNTLLERYIEYKQQCSRLGFDIKDHIGKYLVQKKTTQWDNKNERTVKLYKVNETVCILGTFAKVDFVVELGRRDHLECNKKGIKKMVKAYFDNKNTYLIENNNSLKKVVNNEIEVIHL